MTLKSLYDAFLLVRFTQVKKHGVERREEFLFATPIDCGRFVRMVYSLAVDVPNLVEIVLPKSLRLVDIRNVNESDASNRVLYRCKPRVYGLFQIVCLFERRKCSRNQS